MSYRDILVHLDGGERDIARISLAAGLVRRFGGRLTGLFARVEHFGPSVIARRGSDALEAAAKDSEIQFASVTQGLPSRFWRLAHGEIGHVLGETVVCARVSDLVIVGQHHESKDAPDELIRQLVLESGRPVMVVPSMGDYPAVGSSVMVAWNGSRESARALHDAMPFLETAASVEVVTVRSDTPGSGQPVPPVSILDHLSTHGVRVTREVLAAEDIGIMDLLLSRAFDQGSDLLVMGAKGAGSLPFTKSGSGTKHILEHMTLPVLMSH